MQRAIVVLREGPLDATGLLLVLEAHPTHRTVLLRVPGATQEAVEARASTAAAVVAHRGGPVRQFRSVRVRPAGTGTPLLECGGDLVVVVSQTTLLPLLPAAFALPSRRGASLALDLELRCRLPGGEVPVVDAASVDEEGVSCNGVRDGAAVYVLCPDIRDLYYSTVVEKKNMGERGGGGSNGIMLFVWNYANHACRRRSSV